MKKALVISLFLLMHNAQAMEMQTGENNQQGATNVDSDVDFRIVARLAGGKKITLEFLKTIGKYSETETEFHNELSYEEFAYVRDRIFGWADWQTFLSEHDINSGQLD